MIIIESRSKISNTVLREIKYLRGMQDFLIDQRNSNRYRITVMESMGHTAYCFSTPIYHDDTKKIIHLDFRKTKSGYVFKGASGTVSVCENRCVFENRDGRIVVSLKDTPRIEGSTSTVHSPITLMPTLNGLRFTVKGSDLHLTLKAEIKHQNIRFNPSCFAIMQESFIPFFTVSALYATNDNGVFSPLEMNYREESLQSYRLNLSHSVENATFAFEMNLYEPKLFQDTTVESRHPDTNNVYGAIGFIGKTNQFGEQWLYSRPDFTKIPDLTSHRIEKALLHIPILNRCTDSLDVYIPQKRFCSFGSTWNKRIPSSEKIIGTNNNGRYMTIDVTSLFTSHIDSTLTYSEGMILKKPKGKNDFIAISTGDCYFAPQILELKFKN